MPRAGCFAAVAAPVGSGRDAAETGRVAIADVPSERRTKTGVATGASTVNDPEASDTGCVTAEPSTLTAVALVPVLASVTCKGADDETSVAEPSAPC